MGLYTITTEGAEALAAAATETLLSLMGATTVKAKLIGASISFNGVSATAEPILVELWQITAGGTGTGAVEVKYDRSGPSAQCVGLHSLTVEPTKGDRIRSWYIHPQGGQEEFQLPLGREPVISDGSATQGLCLTAITASGVTASCVAYMDWEE